MSREQHRIDGTVECRDATGSPGRLVGVILPVGRVAADRAEVFVGSGVQTPADGIALLPEHRSSTVVMRFDPVRDADGTLRVDHLLPDTPEGLALAASVRSGKTPGLSVEFHSLDEAQVQGVREVRHSLITAVATVPSQAYDQGTRRSPIQEAAGLAMRWPWAKPEVREADYTSQIVGQMLSRAEGSGDGSLAALEICSRWWGASLSTASISPVNAALAPVDAAFLDFVGRALVRHGEACFVLDVEGGVVALHPVASWHVTGSYRPSDWSYTCTLSGPSSTVTRKLGASQVIHIRYGVSRDRPWKGNSPASMAAATLQAGSRTGTISQ